MKQEKRSGRKRAILVILDGLGDHGFPELDGQTPLQAAATPYLDRLAALGANGSYHAWQQGIALPSEIAHFLMFGYDLRDFPGRGYLEALGEDLQPDPDEVILLGRIFSVQPQEGQLILTVENPEADPATCRALQEEIRHFEHAGVTVTFWPTRGIQGLVRVRGAVAPEITDGNPIYEGRPLLLIQPLAGYENDPAAVRTAQVLNAYCRWAHEQLSRHPVNQKRRRRGLPPLNAVGLQRAGRYRPLEPFSHRWGLRPLALATGPLYRGLCRHLGFDLLPVSDTARPEIDLRQRLELAKAAVDYDFVYIHTKAPDVAAHTKDPQRKKRLLEQLDWAFGYALTHLVNDPDLVLVITADHATNSGGAMIHSGETVPLTIVGTYARRDAVTRFDEVSCVAGSLGQVRGAELMYLILNLLDRGQLYGLLDSPMPRPYFPGPCRPLRLEE